MIDRENFPEEQDATENEENSYTDADSAELESQNGSNNDAIIDSEDTDPERITSDTNMGDSTIGYLTQETFDTDIDPDDKPSTKNLLGDNPPGSETIAFNSGNPGDLSADQAKYQAENIVENFRENIDKAEAEIALDKKLKDEQNDNT